MKNLKQIQYQCMSGVRIRRSAVELDYRLATDELAGSLNECLGVLLASSFEYPGRYTRWDIGFINPPIQIVARGQQMSISALNKRGEILLPEIYRAIQDCGAIENIESLQSAISLSIVDDSSDIEEELRSRRPSHFSVLRELVACFSSTEDPYLGLYGAFGYDLTFQFEDVARYQQRDASDRDLILYLPDQITVADHRIEKTLCYNYEFNCCSWKSSKRTETTGGFRRIGIRKPYTPAVRVPRACDHAPGEYASLVEHAREHFMRGDLFEVVPGQTFFEPCNDSPAEIFTRLKQRNPAPYGALINLGEQEYLVAASPEMFVRVDGKQIETCPISGTIARGADAIGDAEQIRSLLNSAKDESELSMCTDVDRNDKSRVCVPGSVQVIGRRQIEMYSKLIHTVDHVKGLLRPEFDALDGFLAHTWAVTVTGAPKLAAMQFIEQHEKSLRHWYGGALGQIGFDGNMNTGLTLRTVRIKDGVAELRAGATLLMDSDPLEEEKETRLKASALLDAVRGKPDALQDADALEHSGAGAVITALMVDHQDSFVHNLAAYFRACGVELITLRPESARKCLLSQPVDLVILSPGPRRPEDFKMHDTIALAVEKKLPLFGVCLGLQGIVEYFGGKLDQLDYPMHGKSSTIQHQGSEMFEGIAENFTAGRYHSLVASQVPDGLRVTATTEDGNVMAVEHETLPIKAVQFHPESIMSLENRAGHRLISNVVAGIVQMKQLTRANDSRRGRG
ncbi:MAG: anthranilate synthase component I [Gammaproteobacteria bacterium]|jgi:anthranilate synthase|nr:anthranilate synthase component I [Gammaproteobacteria bacterium]MDP6732414.1 anthranilate synthase component I [Gammaproteobacteria bacterium]